MDGAGGWPAAFHTSYAFFLVDTVEEYTSYLVILSAEKQEAEMCSRPVVALLPLLLLTCLGRPEQVRAILLRKGDDFGRGLGRVVTLDQHRETGALIVGSLECVQGFVNPETCSGTVLRNFFDPSDSYKTWEMQSVDFSTAYEGKLPYLSPYLEPNPEFFMVRADASQTGYEYNTVLILNNAYKNRQFLGKETTYFNPKGYLGIPGASTPENIGGFAINVDNSTFKDFGRSFSLGYTPLHMLITDTTQMYWFEDFDERSFFVQRTIPPPEGSPKPWKFGSHVKVIPREQNGKYFAGRAFVSEPGETGKIYHYDLSRSMSGDPSGVIKGPKGDYRFGRLFDVTSDGKTLATSGKRRGRLVIYVYRNFSKSGWTRIKTIDTKRVLNAHMRPDARDPNVPVFSLRGRYLAVACYRGNGPSDPRYREMVALFKYETRKTTKGSISSSVVYKGKIKDPFPEDPCTLIANDFGASVAVSSEGDVAIGVPNSYGEYKIRKANNSSSSSKDKVWEAKGSIRFYTRSAFKK